MKEERPRNIAASVKARLRAVAQREQKAFDEVFLLYLQERLLHRLARSMYQDKFLLKGGLLIYGRKGRLARPTRDIDLLGAGLANDPEALVRVFQELCRMEAEDGVRFDMESVASEGIAEDADYEGVRIKLLGFLEKSYQRLQVDIGFGDVVTPSSIEIDFPTLLNMESPHLRAYSWESVIAEKFEAMVKLSDLNSRMKDFYDVYVLATTQPIDGMVLQQAIDRTFQRRQTPQRPDPAALLPAFGQAGAKQTQWAAFLRRTKIGDVPQSLSEVLDVVQAFLSPIHQASCEGQVFQGTWVPDPPSWITPVS